MILGAHVRRRQTGIEGAIEEARLRDADCVQIFVSNPRAWAGPRYGEAEADRFRSTLAASGIEPCVAHMSYIGNVAAWKPDFLRRTRELLVQTVRACDALGVSFLVVHTGAGGPQSRDVALRAAAQSYRTALEEAETVRIVAELMAGTAGAVASLPAEGEQLLSAVADDRLGIVLDTAHLFAAGVAIDDPDGVTALTEELRGRGLASRLALVHANDSEFGRGERRDRHTNIRDGRIGARAGARWRPTPSSRRSHGSWRRPVTPTGNDGTSPTSAGSARRGPDGLRHPVVMDRPDLVRRWLPGPGPGRAGDAGLFPPGSVARRVNGETALLLGGGRALLLQLAHPLVAAGVAEHSEFRSDPFARLVNTLDLTLTVAFGDEVQRRHAAVRVAHTHRGVVGERDGSAYRALDPELLLWVHATLVDTAIATYERFVGRVGPAVRARYHDEMKLQGAAFGIPLDRLPSSYEAFRRYVDGMVASLVVTDEARELASAVSYPPAPPALRPFAPAMRLITTGLLPDAVRVGYRLAWGPREERWMSLLAGVVRSMVPLLPDTLRRWPHARDADRRLADPRVTRRSRIDAA